jgi:hypothetical protein
MSDEEKGRDQKLFFLVIFTSGAEIKYQLGNKKIRKGVANPVDAHSHIQLFLYKYYIVGSWKNRKRPYNNYYLKTATR